MMNFQHTPRHRPEDGPLSGGTRLMALGCWHREGAWASSRERTAVSRGQQGIRLITTAATYLSPHPPPMLRPGSGSRLCLVPRIAWLAPRVPLRHCMPARGSRQDGRIAVGAVLAGVAPSSALRGSTSRILDVREAT